MPKRIVSIGTAPNDGQGDPLRVAMSKINDNFFEIYNYFGDGTSLTSYASTAGISSLATNLTGSPRINVSGILNTGITTTEHIEVRNITSTGVITATQFVGDGSQLRNVTALVGGLEVLDDNVRKGVARELNFGDNIVSTGPDGVGRVTISVPSTIAVIGIATNAGYATTSGISTTSQGLSGTPNVAVGIITSNISIPNQLRTKSVSEKTTLVAGNTVSLEFNSGSGNVAICTSPTGDITLNVTGIPTDSSFDNNSISLSVVVNQTGTSRTCTAITLNGVSRTIRWAGGSLANAISGVTTTSGFDIFTFTGINTVGSASTTTNYVILGSVSGGFA